MGAMASLSCTARLEHERLDNLACLELSFSGTAADRPSSATSLSLRLASFATCLCGANRNWNSRCFPPNSFSDRVRGGLQRADRNDAFFSCSLQAVFGNFCHSSALSQRALLPWHRALVFAKARVVAWNLVKPSWLVQCSVQRASGCSSK